MVRSVLFKIIFLQIQQQEGKPGKEQTAAWENIRAMVGLDWWGQMTRFFKKVLY